jgi:hypothetical protein
LAVKPSGSGRRAAHDEARLRRQAGAYRLGAHAAGTARPRLRRVLRQQRRLAILCKQLAAEWAPHKINVNVIAPTFVRTEQVAHMLSDASFYNNLVARIPLGRIAEPDDVRNAVLFFVSAASDFITGQTLYLDGGITATQ